GFNATPDLSPTGRYVADRGAGTKVWRIDGATPTVVWEEPRATYFTFAPDDRHAAVSRANGVMCLIDLESGREIRRLGRGRAPSLFSFHTPSQRIAVCTSSDVQIIAWETGTILAELPRPTSERPSVVWHPRGKHVAVASYEDGAVLWDIASCKRAMVYPH